MTSEERQRYIDRLTTLRQVNRCYWAADIAEAMDAGIAALDREGQVIAATQEVIKRLLLWPELHAQQFPGWNGNRFDDQQLAKKALNDAAQLAADHDARLQAEARADERRKVLEEAARVADAMRDKTYWDDPVAGIAGQIRALAAPPEEV